MSSLSKDDQQLLKELLNGVNEILSRDLYEVDYLKEHFLSNMKKRDIPSHSKTDFINPKVHSFKYQYEIIRGEWPYTHEYQDMDDLARELKFTCSNPECDSLILIRDEIRGETFCRECGFIYEEEIQDLSQKQIERIPEIKSNKKNTKIWKPKGRNYDIFHGYSKTEWRKQIEYSNFVDICKSNLSMTKFQVDQVKHFIEFNFNTNGFSKIPYSMEILIAGLCCYYMRRDNPKRVDLNYSNKFFTEIGLNKHKYEVIREKIDDMSIYLK